MGMDDELGSIEPGKFADLILVDGDPTSDISDIRRVVTVVKDERLCDPAAIYRALGIEPAAVNKAIDPHTPNGPGKTAPRMSPPAPLSCPSIGEVGRSL